MDHDAEQQKRESFLVVFYVLAVCCGLFALLFALIGPMTLVVTGVLVGIGGLALMHWWLWGHSLTRAMTEQDAEPAEPPPPPVREDDPYRGRY